MLLLKSLKIVFHGMILIMENRKNILIIDDNDTLRDLLEYALSSFGYGVETAK